MATLASDYNPTGKRGTVKRKKIAVLIDVSGHTTVGSTAIKFSGVITQIVVDVPNLEGAGTVTLAIKDEDGTAHYTKASIAENTKTLDYPVDASNSNPFGICGVITWEITSSVVQIADQTINLVVYYK